MDQTTHTTLRKKISVHTQILAAVMFIGLLFHVRRYLYPSHTVADILSLYIFPEKLWEWAILIPFGILFYAIFLIPVFITIFLLFRWGRVYATDAGKGRKVRNWLIGFTLVLLYNWGGPAVYVIQQVFPPKEVNPFPAGVRWETQPSLEAEEKILQHLLDDHALISHKTEMTLNLIVLLLYTIETGWIFSLLWKAEVFEKKQLPTDAGGSSLS
ncbi:hypothetical protein SAMN05428949_6291 [Chitinophaga sp. YR627]|uniref:hypothetical protein n=1 Tax=Chitinophaga sp. YR627 TaxID=1881041 RepID=UPI0008E94562|nr:hypothetical protein [Chitinophaga sp. YR627]SFO71129.1 hypothetical protein SAMN05428949_6291 [Chitinophaga sp. YR627]